MMHANAILRTMRYRPNAKQLIKQVYVRHMCALAIATGLMLVAAVLPFRRQSVWINLTDATIRTETFVLGIKFKSQARQSLLSQWCKLHNLKYNRNRWVLMDSSYYNMFNSEISHGHGDTPPIIPFSIDSICARVLTSSTQEEIRAFMEVLGGDDDTVKAAAIEQLLYKGIEAPTKPGDSPQSGWKGGLEVKAGR